MLLLTRKVGDSILIGDSIKIQVVRVQGYQVRLGIEAPKEVKIFREEILKNRSTEHKKVSLDLNQTTSNELSSDSPLSNLSR